MYNDSERISAGEINKFTYCPYQWYYERLYGKKFIMQKVKELNPDYISYADNKFSRGNRFHKYFRIKYVLRCVALIIFTLATVIFLFWRFL